MDRQATTQLIDGFFDRVSIKPEQYNVDELVAICEAIIPVHVNLTITSFEEVDDLLAIYPYLFQKMVKLFAYFSHKVRISVITKDKAGADNMRIYRDAFEQLMRAVRLQYDSLSRRITVNIERR